MNTDLRIIKAIKKIIEDVEKDKSSSQQYQQEIKTSQKKIEESIRSINKEQTKIKEEKQKDKKELVERINNIQMLKPKDGVDGKDGRDGARGERGLPGERGFPGRDGVDGKDGRDGKDGVGIKSARINKSGELILILTNNKKINCGVVKGQDGFGFSGVSVVDIKIENGHLICILSNGREIDAGVISGGGPGGEETDPIFTASPAYNITNQDISNWNNKSDFSGDYEDLNNLPIIPTVPTNVSAFTNDAGYLTEHQSLSGYATEQWVENKNYLTQHQDISGKYDKTGGEISGNVKIDGTLTLDIEDEDYDAGIRFDKSLNENLI